VPSYDDRPWLAHYLPSIPAMLPAPTETVLGRFRRTAERIPGATCLTYFDRSFTFVEIDRLSSSLAAAMAHHGIAPGDRIALFLQNDPEYAISELAAWKLGAVVVSINPMLRDAELEHILVDSGAIVLVALADLWRDVAASVAERSGLRLALLCEPGHWLGQGRSDTVAPSCCPLEDFAVAVQAPTGQTTPVVDPGLDDVAILSYTSGTSGRPKGVVTTHGNLAYNADVYRVWIDIDDSDRFLMATPVFHITGLVAGLALGFSTGMPVVLFHRFSPEDFLREAARWETTFCVMAITAFQAVLRSPASAEFDVRGLTKVYSGGAPVSIAASRAWESLTGHPIHNVYGLTETTGPTHAVPFGRRAPVDPATGAMSVGVPVPGAEVKVVDPETLRDVPAGEPGELWIRGPMVSPGYWNLPEATTEAFSDGFLRTGDIGFMDDEGWFYVIDRMKDMINASGFKVWPREVEELLQAHPSVDEAAVVGIPDAYRGETVAAYVTLRPGDPADADGIIAFARRTMAAYKCPRFVAVVDELPKTASGKILRRELRHRAIRDWGAP
jgi:long-chain acyl-CoA synthetase